MTSPLTSPITRRLTYALTTALGAIVGPSGDAGTVTAPVAYYPPWLAKELTDVRTPSGYIYVRTTSHGTGDGSSWDNAINPNTLNTIVGQAHTQNKQIVLLAGEGDFTPTVGQTITNAGASRSNPVVIRGVNSDLTPATVTITGDRAPVFAPGATTGSTFLKFGAAAAYITFSNINFKAWGGTGTLLFNTSGASNIAVLDCAGENLYRFIDNNSGVAVSNITVKRFDGHTVGGFERSFSRFRGNSHDVYIEDVNADGGGNIDDLFQVGFSLEDTAHYVIYRRCTASNWRFSPDSDPGIYWNADGFSTERTNYGVLCDTCTAHGCTDGGFDFKSTNTYFFNCLSFDNKNNYRLWGDAILLGCTSLDPFKRGGTGVTCHFNIAQSTTPNLHIINCTRSDTDPNTKTFYVEHAAALFYSSLNGTTAGDLAQYENVDPIGTITQISSPGVSPFITSDAAKSVEENSAFAIALAATGSPLFWAISGGADYGQFLIDGWIMTRSASPTLTFPAQDYETPLDANMDNAYVVQVAAYGEGLAAGSQSLTVTVTDIPFEGLNIYEGDYFEIPLGNTNDIIPNGQKSAGKALPADVVYSLLPGYDSALFSIGTMGGGAYAGASTNVLKLPAQTFASPADFDGDNIYVAAWQGVSTKSGDVTTGFTQVRVNQLTVGSAQRYMGPTASGSGDGSSWANRAAASGATLNNLIGQVGPGGFINIAWDQGTYPASTFSDTPITNGGGPGSGVITIRGMNSSGTPGNVVISGTRTTFTPPVNPETPTSVTGWTVGGDTFKLGTGANNLKFLNFAPSNGGSFWHAIGSFHGVTLDTITGFNFQRFFEQEHQTVIGHLTVQDVTINGYSKQAWRCRGANHDITYLRVNSDSMRQDRDSFAVGYEISDFAHDISFTDCTGNNSYSSVADSSGFVNGDGASSEDSNYNISFVNGTYSGNTDGGLDMKAAGVTLNGTTASDNRSNYKFWYFEAFWTGCISANPHKRLGTGGENHVEAQASDTLVTRLWYDATCQFIDTNASCNVFFANNDSGPVAAVHFHVAPGATISTLGTLFKTIPATLGSTNDNFTTNPPWDIIAINAPAVVSSGNYTFTEPATSTLPSPQYPAAGDLMVVSISYRDTANFTLPVGWTLIRQETSGNTTTGGIASALMAYCIRGSSAPDMTFTRTGGGKALGSLRIYRKYDGTTAVLDDSNSATQGASTTTPVCPSITTTADNALILGLVACPRDTGVTAFSAATDPATASGAVSAWDYPYPGKFIARVNSISSGTTQVSTSSFDAIRATAGATGQFSGTAGASGRQAVIVAAFK